MPDIFNGKQTLSQLEANISNNSHTSSPNPVATETTDGFGSHVVESVIFCRLLYLYECDAGSALGDLSHVNRSHPL